jgi:hypothetical protein
MNQCRSRRSAAAAFAPRSRGRPARRARRRGPSFDRAGNPVGERNDIGTVLRPERPTRQDDRNIERAGPDDDGPSPPLSFAKWHTIGPTCAQPTSTPIRARCPQHDGKASRLPEPQSPISPLVCIGLDQKSLVEPPDFPMLEQVRSRQVNLSSGGPPNAAIPTLLIRPPGARDRTPRDQKPDQLLVHQRKSLWQSGAGLDGVEGTLASATAHWPRSPRRASEVMIKSSSTVPLLRASGSSLGFLMASLIGLATRFGELNQFFSAFSTSRALAKSPFRVPLVTLCCAC